MATHGKSIQAVRDRAFEREHGRPPISFPVTVVQEIGRVDESDEGTTSAVEAAFTVIGGHVSRQPADAAPQMLEFIFRLPIENGEVGFSVNVDIDPPDHQEELQYQEV